MGRWSTMLRTVPIPPWRFDCTRSPILKTPGDPAFPDELPSPSVFNDSTSLCWLVVRIVDWSTESQRTVSPRIAASWM